VKFSIKPRQHCPLPRCYFAAPLLFVRDFSKATTKGIFRMRSALR